MLPCNVATDNPYRTPEGIYSYRNWRKGAVFYDTLDLFEPDHRDMEILAIKEEAHTDASVIIGIIILNIGPPRKNQSQSGFI